MPVPQSETSSTTPSEFEVDNPTFLGAALEPGFTVALVSGVEAGDGVEDVTFKPSSCSGSRRPCKIRARGGHAVRMHRQKKTLLSRPQHDSAQQVRCNRSQSSSQTKLLLVTNVYGTSRTFHGSRNLGGDFPIIRPASCASKGFVYRGTRNSHTSILCEEACFCGRWWCRVSFVARF